MSQIQLSRSGERIQNSRLPPLALRKPEHSASPAFSWLYDLFKKKQKGENKGYLALFPPLFLTTQWDGVSWRSALFSIFPTWISSLLVVGCLENVTWSIKLCGIYSFSLGFKLCWKSFYPTSFLSSVIELGSRKVLFRVFVGGVCIGVYAQVQVLTPMFMNWSQKTIR